MRASRAAVPILGLSSTFASATLSSCRITAVLHQPQCPAAYSTSSLAHTPQTFSYRLAASFSGKDTYYKPQSDTYTFTPSRPSHKHYNHVRPATRANSGQDAFFITSVGSNTGTVAFGIADGVGGWMDSGVDPATFSHGLCHYMSSRAERTDAASASTLHPGALLQAAYNDVEQDANIDAGGSTACIAVARPDGKLEVANLGDSGFVQLRPGKVAYASEPQTHAFNTPYQLSLIPAAMRAQSAAFGGEMLHDGPGDAEISHHTVRHGDVLVFASDGVWDNLSAADVLAVVGRFMTSFSAWGTNGSDDAQEVLQNKGSAEEVSATSTSTSTSMSSLLDALTQDGGIPTKDRTLQAALAIAVAGEAKIASLDKKRDGPFAREVQRYYPGEDWRGGKVDDISVVVAVVVGKS